MPNPFRKDETMYWNKDKRNEYLNIIEKKIAHNPLFKYTRIQQIPRDTNDTLDPYIGRVATLHICRLLEDFGSTERVSLMYIKSDEISGFMIIDDHILIHFISGIDADCKKVLAAITIQGNKHEDNTIKDFCNSFSTFLIKQSSTITREMLQDEASDHCF